MDREVDLENMSGIVESLRVTKVYSNKTLCMAKGFFSWEKEKLYPGSFSAREALRFK